MEIRRVQITGGSSYVMTLPKEWVKSSNIKKNDALGVHVQSDGTLLVTPKMTREQVQKIKYINVEDISKQTFLLQRLIAAYIAGYTSVKINSPTRLSPDVRSTVRRFTQITIGQEIIEENDKHILIKDLLNPVEMPFDRTIKRMHIIVRGMHEDALRTLENKDEELTYDVIVRDNEVDRLHWLVARQHNSILQNVSLAEKMNITIGLSSTYFLISRIIERIGDHVVKIAKNIPNVSNPGQDKEIIYKIKNTSEVSKEIFSKSVGAFFRKDIKAATENADIVSDLEELCEEIDKLALKQKGINAISIGYIVESTRRIGEYAKDISENVINYLIGLENK